MPVRDRQHPSSPLATAIATTYLGVGGAVRAFVPAGAALDFDAPCIGAADWRSEA
jgi:hypothetical protein